jgi:hypothetical protein
MRYLEVPEKGSISKYLKSKIAPLLIIVLLGIWALIVIASILMTGSSQGIITNSATLNGIMF